MFQKRISFLSVLIVAIPILVYFVFELTSLSKNENLVREIYSRQMELVLQSVNNYSWEKVNSWPERIENYLSSEDVQKNLNDYLSTTGVINDITITDTVGTVWYFAGELKQDNNERISSFIKDNLPILNRLFYRKKLGYTKIEVLSWEDELKLCFVANSPDNRNFLTLFSLNEDRFLSEIIVPLLNDIANNEFQFAIVKKSTNEIKFSSGKIGSDDLETTNNLWFLPDYQIGIKLQGTSIQELSKDRFYSAMLIIVVLGLSLAIGGYYLNQNLRKEFELSKMKTDFVSNVSHELRTPLALIRMFAETIELRRSSSEKETTDFAKVIRQESERLTLMINKLLDFSKIEAGKKEYHFAEFSLNEEVAEVLNLYKFHIKSKEFSLKVDFADDDLIVKGDKDSIIEAFVNLLENSIKYSSSEKEIMIRTGREKEFVYFEVADKGIGIPKEAQEEIFEKFYRVRGELNNPIKGSGLGLSLVKHIVEAHNGKVEVQSKVGKGSNFKVLFPV